VELELVVAAAVPLPKYGLVAFWPAVRFVVDVSSFADGYVVVAGAELPELVPALLVPAPP
jgi:hypothetical protein